MLSGVFGYPLDYFVWSAIYVSLLLHAWCFFRCFPKDRKRKTRLIIGNSLIFLCLLGTAAWIGETYIRFVYVATDSFGVSLPARRWFALHTSLNSFGCRDREWAAPKPAGTRRIAFVGDSFTFGWGIEKECNRFTGLLQSRFDMDASKVEVINVAMPGWSTGSQLQPVKNLVEVLEVDEVVLCYVANDLEDLITTTPEFNPTRPPESKWFNPDSSCLLDFLWRRLYVPRSPTVSGYFSWLVKGYGEPYLPLQAQRIEKMADQCRAGNVTFRAVLLPFIKTPPEYNRGEIHAKMKEVFHSAGVEVADLGDLLGGMNPRDLVVNSADAHPNELAHKLFAEAIWNAFYKN